jgi:cytochrome c
MLNYRIGCCTLACLAAFTPTISTAQDRIDVDQLARSQGCYECHGGDRDGIGPSFSRIAGRYSEDEGGRAVLFNAVKDGGKGNWTALTGGVPMPPYWGRLSDEQIRELVDWILSYQE